METSRVDLIQNPKQILDDPLIPLREVAGYLGGLSIQTLYNWINANRIQTVKLRGYHYVKMSEIQRIISEGVE